jgi:hypothetical protein
MTLRECRHVRTLCREPDPVDQSFRSPPPRRVFVSKGTLPASSRRHLGLLAAPLLLASPLFAQPDAQGAAPIAVVTLAPIPEDTPAPPELEPADDLPDALPLNPELWRAVKEAARTDPRAQPPDSILNPPGRLLAPALVRQAAAVSFAGLSYVSGEGSPSDVNVARSPQRTLQAVNRRLRLWNSNNVELQTVTLATFFSAVEAPFDPKVLFDRNATNQRFFVTATERLSSRLHLAVSRAANPSDLDPSSWCRYFLSTTDDFDPATPTTFADQPKIGVGTDAFLVSSDYFTVSTPSFTYVIIHAFDKIGLTNNAASCPIAKATVFRPSSTEGDTDTFSLQPVNHYNQAPSFPGTTNPVYLVSSLSADLAHYDYKVWRIRNVLSGASPNQLQQVTVTGSSQYATPPQARQAGTTSVLDTTDARITLAAGASNALWFAHGTSCQNGRWTHRVMCARGSCQRRSRCQWWTYGLSDSTDRLWWRRRHLLLDARDRIEREPSHSRSLPLQLTEPLPRLGLDSQERIDRQLLDDQHTGQRKLLSAPACTF